MNHDDRRRVEVQNKNMPVTELEKISIESKNYKSQKHHKVDVEDEREIELKRELRKCRNEIEIKRNADMV